MNFYCKKCQDCGSLREITKYCRRSSKNFGTEIINKKYNKWVFSKIMKRNDDVPKCPNCMKRMQEKPKLLVKLYASKDMPFVDREQLLNRYTSLRWNKEDYRNGFMTFAVSAYQDKLEYAKNNLNWLNNKLHKKMIGKGKKVSIKLKPVTEKRLKKDLELYEQRKTEKLI